LFIVAWIVRFAVKSLHSVTENFKPMVIGFIIGFLALHVAIFFVALYTPWLFIWAITGAVLRILVEQKRLAGLTVTLHTPSAEQE